MDRKRVRWLVGTVSIAALLVGGTAWPETGNAQQGPNQVVEGAKKVGQGVEETAKGIGRAVTDGAKRAGDELKPTADNLHDRAKGFGETLWDGMKSLGRAVTGFFGR